ncbi:MAG TPA: NUDIX domain-containing protein [Candidatus Sulfotelmatobacter sp.]|jgi:8-oxo-dGTP diphosphatase|nr:NUDIX domain-containing protein [Candidatus Sulfotelmatobacter sp.]
MIIDGLDMKYVIGFPMTKTEILLIKRNKHPWINKWNGAGGKIEQGENAMQAIYREILEETEIDLKKSETKFTGIVTWDRNNGGDNNTGMYAFISQFHSNQPSWKKEKIIEEGIVAWKPIEWACNKSTKEIADTVPYFLPLMMVSKNPQRYHCIFRNNIVKEVKVLPLPKGIISGKFL